MPLFDFHKGISLEGAINTSLVTKDYGHNATCTYLSYNASFGIYNTAIKRYDSPLRHSHHDPLN